MRRSRRGTRSAGDTESGERHGHLTIPPGVAGVHDPQGILKASGGRIHAVPPRGVAGVHDPQGILKDLIGTSFANWTTTSQGYTIRRGY